ncbi:hypothetical protein LXL04_023860 [Taraxacum kok-saghyz]
MDYMFIDVYQTRNQQPKELNEPNSSSSFFNTPTFTRSIDDVKSIDEMKTQVLNTKSMSDVGPLQEIHNFATSSHKILDPVSKFLENKIENDYGDNTCPIYVSASCCIDHIFSTRVTAKPEVQILEEMVSSGKIKNSSELTGLTTFWEKDSVYPFASSKHFWCHFDKIHAKFIVTGQMGPTSPPVKVARSCKFDFLFSPNPGALMAQTYTTIWDIRLERLSKNPKIDAKCSAIDEQT